MYHKEKDQNEVEKADKVLFRYNSMSGKGSRSSSFSEKSFGCREGQVEKPKRDPSKFKFNSVL